MKSLFVKIAFSATLIIGGATASLAQETASLPSAISSQPTVNQCSAGNGVTGTCVNATGGYMNSLVAQALPAEQFSQELANFIIALTALAQADETCNEMDNEIPKAIRLAASYALDPEQRAQFISIADTISSCGDFTTAAIAPTASPN